MACEPHCSKHTAWTCQSVKSYILKSGSKKLDNFKNWPLVKNPHFLFNPHETWWKKSPHELIIFTEFHKDRTKSVDFLIRANFWMCAVFYSSDFIQPPHTGTGFFFHGGQFRGDLVWNFFLGVKSEFQKGSPLGVR